MKFKLLKLVMKESIQSASETMAKIMKLVREADPSSKFEPQDIYVVKNNDKYDIMWVSGSDGDTARITSVDVSELPEADLVELGILKDMNESVVRRVAAEEVLNEDSAGTEAYDQLVAGDDIFFRDEDGQALLAHYANSYQEPEEYDEGYITGWNKGEDPAYDKAQEEKFRKAKEAAENGDVWEFLIVDESTCQPTSETYAVVYGQDELMNLLGAMRRVNKVSRLEENLDNASFEEIIRDMENAETYEDLYNAAMKIVNPDLQHDVTLFIQQCEEDGDSVEEAYSIVTTDLLDDRIQDLNEDYYISINDGKSEDPDYIIQDVTELEELEDGDVEAPSIEGLLSLVNESLSNKYGDTWGFIKSKSVAMKESLQYAIIDIVTPQILREAKENKIKDNAVSKTVILESVPNSKSLVNLKINTLAGTTRFSQKTREPAKVLTRWLESEYLYDEMVKDFQAKIEARQAELKDTVESYLKAHPDLKIRIETIKAQEKLLKDAKVLEGNEDDLARLAYAIAAEFPANTNVKGNKDNEYEMEFDTIDEIVKLLFGESYVRDIPKEEKELAKKNKKVLKDNLKEGYESFKIGEIEGTFNPATGEALYSIPSKNIVDKKLSLDKVATVDTPYDTETIIKDYIERNYGTIQSTEEPTQPEPLEEPVETEVSAEEPLSEDGEEVDNNSEMPEETQDAQSETGSASFYKVRQREPITIEDLLEKTANGESAQESDYIVIKEIDLNNEEAQEYLSNLSKPQAFLQNLEPIDRKNYAFNVVKVNTPTQTLLVDPVGYEYSRYIALI